jgi:hypothetical protein
VRIISSLSRAPPWEKAAKRTPKPVSRIQKTTLPQTVSSPWPGKTKRSLTRSPSQPLAALDEAAAGAEVGDLGRGFGGVLPREADAEVHLVAAVGAPVGLIVRPEGEHVI